MLWKVFLYAGVIAGVSCVELQLGQMSIHDLVEHMCTKNNAKDKTAQAEAGIHSFVKCLSEHHDPTIFRDLYYIHLDDKQSVIALYKRACRQAPEYKTCMFTLWDDIAVCGGPNSTEEITKGKKALDELLVYLCGNDAERFIKFVNDGSLQCVVQKYEALKKCALNAFEDWSSGDLNAILDFSSAEIAKSCATWDKLLKCVHTTLAECPTSTANEFVEGIVELVRKVSRCN